jgi:predicted Rossmann fold flavoprotein
MGDLVIVGGGAAGLMAAIAACEAGGARPGVVVLEAAGDVGRKVLISGGGRCNVLPMEEAPARFVSSSPGRLVRRFLDRFDLALQRAFFEALLGGALREEPQTRKLFPPSNRAKDVRDALRERAERAGAAIRAGSPVRDVEKAGDGFRVALDGGGELRARAVILTTGGRSVLGGGADAKGFEWAAAFGHTIRPTYPALAPLVGDAPRHHALAGISMPARVEATWAGERAVSSGGFLFTHRGWSGPAVLDVSHVVERAALAGGRAEVRVGFEEVSASGPGRPAGGSPAGDAAARWDATLRGAGGSLSVLPFLRKSSVPDRLARLLLEEAGVPDESLSRLPRDARERLVKTLTAFPLPATGTEGYRTAEVTGGGVALEEVDPGSGASRRVPGLFFAGEILDAFGPIGGFNFQWAWATGWTAGASAARSLGC